MRHYAWTLGIRSLRQNLRRNLALGLAIALGYVGLLMISGYATRVGDYFRISTIFLQNSGHITVFKKDGLRKHKVKPQKFSLDPEAVQAVSAYLDQQSEASLKLPYLFAAGLVSNGCQSFLFSARGLNPTMQKQMLASQELRSIEPSFNNLLAGKSLWEFSGKDGLILGSGLAHRLKITLADESIPPPNCPDQLAPRELQLISRSMDRRLSATDAQAVGIIQSGVSLVDRQSLEAPMDLLQELLDTDKISYLAIFLKHPERAPEIARSLEQRLGEQNIAIDAYVWNDKELNPSYVNGMAILDFSIAFVRSVILFVVLLSVINTLTIGLAESRRSIGGLRAIGFKARQVAAIFCVEAFAVSIIGILTGLGFAQLSIKLISLQNVPFRIPGLPYATTFQLTPDAWDHSVSAVLLLFLVLIVTLLKTRNYARQSILTLLDAGA